MPRMPLYQQLAETIRSQIAAGVFGPGERLPSIRRLREEHRVSLNTIKSALQLLEDWRIVQVRPQSGHFVATEVATSPSGGLSQTGKACLVQTNIPVRMNSALSIGPQATLGAAVQSPELMPTKALTRLFQKVMRDEPARLWLRSPVPALDYDKPMELIEQGEYRRVIGAILSIGEGVTA
jgi:DNA-binding transcriptional regulator YhcF (GntR family)